MAHLSLQNLFVLFIFQLSWTLSIPSQIDRWKVKKFALCHSGDSHSSTSVETFFETFTKQYYSAKFLAQKEKREIPWEGRTIHRCNFRHMATPVLNYLNS